MPNYLISVDADTKQLPQSVLDALPFSPKTIVDARVDGGKVWLIQDDRTEIPLGDLTGPAGPNTVPTNQAVADALTSDGPAKTTFTAVVPAVAASNYGAAGDGVTDDRTALLAGAASAAVFGLTLRLTTGKTYKVGSSMTISVPFDLNGATVVVTGALTVSSGSLRGGTVSVVSQVQMLDVARVRVEDVSIVNTTSTSSGLVVRSSDVRIARVKVTGGWRGIILDKCDNYEVFGCTISEVRASGGYGIIATSETGMVRGNGTIHHNRIVNCWFGICLNGGEADSTKPAWAADYTIQNVTVHDNIVSVDDPETLIGCIWATRSRWVDFHNNTVQGGADVGIDFEYCTDSAASDNIVNDVKNGGLAAIFGSSRIMFAHNTVTFARSRAGAASTTGVTWKGTSNIGLLLRDDPSDIRLVGNKFHSENGTLMQLVGGNASTRVTLADNDLFNAYFVAFNTVAGAYKDLVLSQNKARFSININRPVFQVQSVTRATLERNDILLIAGEVHETAGQATINVLDVGAANSSFVTIRQNRVVDPAAAANCQIAINSNDSGMVATITDNVADRIGVYWLSGAFHTNTMFGRNFTPNGVEIGLRAADNNSVPSASRRSNRKMTVTNALAAPPSSGFNLGMADFFVFTGTAAATWTLPTVGNAAAGADLTIKNRGSAVLTINSNAGGNDICGTAAVASVAVAAGTSLHLVCDGTYWNVI